MLLMSLKFCVTSEDFVFVGSGVGVAQLGVCTIQNLGIQAIGSWARYHFFHMSLSFVVAQRVNTEARSSLQASPNMSPCIDWPTAGQQLFRHMCAKTQ